MTCASILRRRAGLNGERPGASEKKSGVHKIVNAARRGHAPHRTNKMAARWGELDTIRSYYAYLSTLFRDDSRDARAARERAASRVDLRPHDGAARSAGED